MRAVNDILLYLQSGHQAGTTEHDMLYTTFVNLSDKEKRPYEKLSEAGMPIEQLLECLKNRIQRQALQAEPTAVQLDPVIQPPSSDNASLKPYLSKPLTRSVKRIAYVLNSLPKYILPDWQSKCPPIIQRLVGMAQHAIPTPIWDRLHMLHKLEGVRLGISTHRRLAIEAIIPCLLGATNIETRLCWLCAGRIAVLCGLTLSRVSRALDDLAQAGLIVCKRTRDQKGLFQPLGITVTMAMIKAFGVIDVEWLAAQKSYKKLSKKAEAKIPYPSTVLSSQQAAHQSLLNIKRRLKPPTASLIQRISERAADMAQRVEKALQASGFGSNLTFSFA